MGWSISGLCPKGTRVRILVLCVFKRNPHGKAARTGVKTAVIYAHEVPHKTRYEGHQDVPCSYLNFKGQFRKYLIWQGLRESKNRSRDAKVF